MLLLVLLQVSCQNNEFIGYKDLLVKSPLLLWGSSKEEVKSKYPDVEEIDNYFFENNLNGKIKNRLFEFIDNKLFFVGVSYGSYSNEELDLLRNELEKNYGISLLEDNGTIESWHIKSNENNNIVFMINKLQNNIVNCSYINPLLRDRYDKK